MSKRDIQSGLSPREKIQLESMKGYRAEIDCNAVEVTKRLEARPKWRLNDSDRQQYQRMFNQLARVGVSTAKCEVGRDPVALFGQMRVVRLSLGGRVRELEARDQLAQLGPIDRKLLGDGARQAAAVRIAKRRAKDREEASRSSIHDLRAAPDKASVQRQITAGGPPKDALEVHFGPIGSDIVRGNSPAERVEGSAVAGKLKGDIGRLKKADGTQFGSVPFPVAEAYAGITPRRRQQLMKGVLGVVGSGKNRRITVKSLVEYCPPNEDAK